jgi:hypothetical protein
MVWVFLKSVARTGGVMTSRETVERPLPVNKAESGNSPHIYNSCCFQLASMDSFICA